MKDGLYLSNLFNLSNLREKCLKWSAKHFKQLWATKKFCMQRKEIHEECYNTVASALVV
uniref:BTBD8 BACK domain-containing protein n=1 Tax=Ciona intestinalis TaxID=7719 RepID=H2XVV2_CIOIN